MRALLVLLTVLGIAAAAPRAQRERTRPTWDRPAAVTESQAAELTLTVTEAAVRPLQIWVRIAGVIDDARQTVTASVPESQGRRVRVGQRVRVFSPASRSRMYQATVSRISRQGEKLTLNVTLAGRALEAGRHFILEIVTEEGEFLSVPNEAILESDGRQIVYVHQADGSHAPREIKVGVRGELYTQVLDGVTPGQQVVTIGSFFIDAEHKLKGS